MRHQKRKFVLGRKTGPRRALVRDLTISLIENGRLITTVSKAKVVQQSVEPLITRGKVKSVHNIRIITKKLANSDAALKVVNDWSPKFKERKGGYTRITKIQERKGDGAPQAVIEFVLE